MIRSCILITLSILILTALGCKKPEAQPEILDPIYRDIESEFRSSQRAVIDSQKEVDAAKLELQKIKPQTRDHKLKWQAFYSATERARIVEQQARYLEIRLYERKKKAREEYMTAFKADKPWPLPDEYSHYLREKARAKNPRSWSQSLSMRLAAKKGPKKSTKSPEGHAPASEH